MTTANLPVATNNPADDYFIPDDVWIASLKVGDLAPDCWGEMSEIVKISARDYDLNGKLFVCLNLRFGPTSTISDSFKADELHRSCKVTYRHSSHELDMIERQYHNV
jgi:hypothetical protein